MKLMGNIIPLPPRASDDEGGDPSTTQVGFVVEGQYYEVDVTSEEAADLIKVRGEQ